MISITLLKRNIKTCMKPFLLVFAVICMYTVIIVYMYDPDFAEMLEEYQQKMPEVMAAMGMTGIASSLIEWMQIYLYGFIMMLFPLIFIIVMVQKLVMGYIDSGSMANLLATGNSRGEIICTQAFSAVLWMVLLMGAVNVAGIFSGMWLFPGELNVERYLILNISTLFLQLVVAGISFLCACVCSEARHYYTVGAGLPLLFFLMQMISNMGEKLENLKYFTIYTLLPAEEIAAGKGCMIQNLVLLFLAMVLFGSGIWWFQRRDLGI